MKIFPLAPERKWQALVVSSLAAGLFLDNLYLPKIIFWFYPSWIGVIVLYWMFYHPNASRVGILAAWAAGLAADILSGGLWGQKALAMALMARAAMALQSRMDYALLLRRKWQEISLVFLALLVLEFCVSIINWLAGGQALFSLFFLKAAVGALLFAPVAKLANAIVLKFTVQSA